MLPIDLRIVFLFFLLVTLLLFRLHFGSTITFGQIQQMLLGTLLLVSMIAMIGSFVALLTRQDPLPLIRRTAYEMSFRHLISLEAAIPPNLTDNLDVASISRHDLDGDDFNEWVVFYKFDTRDSNDPIAGYVFDNDRGNPPVIFPYSLRAPDRNYLSEDALEISLSQENITEDTNGPDGVDLPEIMVQGANELTLFRFRQNSELWDFPRDAPPRYQPIGFFRGTGGVEFDSETKNVTVIDRNGFERSQLSIRSVYALNPATNTYLDSFDDKKLAAPIISTIDFFPSAPDDIFDTAFPEKIVLAFYAANCVEVNQTLCRNASAGWAPRDFLAPNSEADQQFNDGVSNYFGLPAFGGIDAVSVTNLRYYPGLETDPDLLPTGGGRDVVTGEQAQLNVVDIAFTVDGAPLEAARYEMGLAEGRWKIIRRLPLDTLALDAPIQLPTSVTE